MEQPANDILKQLTISEIASWQVPDATRSPLEILATLPALQRGYVWKPKQIENLWDSLMRCFPIGSFLVAPYANGRLGNQNMRYARGDDGREYTHYLLDGQQRATAIALGFIDPCQPKTSASLWLDLDPSTGKADDREYVFRIINQYHPWGFSRANAENKLEAKKIREAFEAFKGAANNEEDLRIKLPSQFPLKHAWPWDAIAPIPVAFLWGAATPNDVLKKLQQLPYWNSAHPPIWKKDVEKNILDGNSSLGKRLVYILRQFHELQGCRIPVLIVPMDSNTPVSADAELDEKPDHLETLFVRVNSSGTTLEGEELMYSLLKSEWTEAPQFIENLPRHFATPARTVVLAARLVLARMQKEKTKQDKPTQQPPVPNVSMFRRLLRGADKLHPNFKDELKKALTEERQNDITPLFNATYAFLTLDTSKARDYRLPPYLVADLARGTTGHEVMFLLLRWIDRLIESDVNLYKLDETTNRLANLDETTHRRTLGFITALAWFSVNAKDCVARLWHELQTCDVGNLKDFFNAERFQALIKRNTGEGVILIPPISSLVFKEFLDGLYNSIEATALTDSKSGYWKNYYFDRTDNRQALVDWMKAFIHPLWQENQREEVEILWIDRIWADRRFVIYVQRNHLMCWFPDYDPTVPGGTDINRPWDYDHIHPNNLISGRRNMPSFLKHLHWSNGNFRAWPLEANRSDQDSIPDKKLKTLSSHEERYGLVKEDLPEASFITDEELKLWCLSAPTAVIAQDAKYLSLSQQYRENHLALVKAITQRFGRIYAEWFDKLLLEDLLPKTEK